MDFSARGSALGYYYQARYALYLLIAADRDESEIAIEKLDDISFEENGTVYELLQTKHHISSTASLTNMSPDLWKSLRIWSTKVAEKDFKKDTILTLVTTAITPDNDSSITRKLRPRLGRDNHHIASELLEVANRSNNAELKSSFDAYRSLTDQQREELVSSIQILDGSPDITDTADKIRQKLLVRPQYREAIFTRLEGWWFDQVIRHLQGKSETPIKKLELINVIADISDQFHPDSLPIDYINAEPPEKPDPTNDQRRFVDQLRVISLQNKQIENAIKDYYRAFEQRSRWEREQLVNIGELGNYEKRLTDEWERQSLWDSYNDHDDEDMKRWGRNLFKWAEQADISIRRQVTEPYVMRGSFHILANEPNPRVYWHPKFIERLKTLVQIPDPTAIWENRPLEIRNLFNPAFCAHLIHDALKGYQQEKNEGMPYPLLFLILPVILHKQTRDSLPRGVSTKFHVWLNKNSHLRVDFAQRTRDLVSITREALYFGIDSGHITMSDADTFISTKKPFKKTTELLKSELDISEISEIRKRAPFMGRWYGQAGTVASIYVMWGIRP